MRDSVIIIAASVTALIGLLLLFVAKPAQQENFVLQGSVLEAGKGKAVLQTNVTVVGKNLTQGYFNRSVFWNGNAFIALN